MSDLISRAIPKTKERGKLGSLTCIFLFFLFYKPKEGVTKKPQNLLLLQRGRRKWKKLNLG